MRALSPGINDPYTAVNVLEELAPGIAEMVSSPRPATALADDAGTPRVFLRQPGVRDLLDVPSTRSATTWARTCSCT